MHNISRSVYKCNKMQLKQSVHSRITDLPAAKDDVHRGSCCCRHRPQQQCQLQRRLCIGPHDLVHKSESKRHGKDPDGHHKPVLPPRIRRRCLEQLDGEEEADYGEICGSNEEDGPSVSPGAVGRHGAVEGQHGKPDDFGQPVASRSGPWTTAAGVWGKQIRTVLITSIAHNIHWTPLDWRWTTDAGAGGVVGGNLIWTPFMPTAQKVYETPGRTTAAGVGVLLTRALLEMDDNGGGIGGHMSRRRKDAGVAHLLSRTVARADRRRHHVGAG